MKNYMIFFWMVLLVVACGGEAPSSDNSSESTTNTDQTNVTAIPADPGAAATPPPTAEPAQNTDGVWHYTCPNGCAGGAGSAVPCPKCGTTLTHNSGYHGGQNNVQLENPGNIDIQQSPPPGAEPAQNANGVWHYTCPKGCAGGAGSASACKTCGTTLAHNAAYHQ